MLLKAVGHAAGHAGTVKMILLLLKEGSGVVNPVVTLAPTAPATPPAEEGSHFRSSEEPG